MASARVVDKVRHGRVARASPLTANASLSLCMVLVNIEVAIIGTSLISITDDLQGFSQMGWVVTGYLSTYTGPW
jgi:hypothetical protein